MREIRTYGSMRGLQTEAARGPVRSSRVRRTVLDHSSLIPLRSTLLVKLDLRVVNLCKGRANVR